MQINGVIVIIKIQPIADVLGYVIAFVRPIILIKTWIIIDVTFVQILSKNILTADILIPKMMDYAQFFAYL